MKKILPIVLMVTVSAWAGKKQPPPEILKIKLGMTFARARSRLNQIGRFKSEIVGFDAGRKVRYVTVLARPDGVPMRYEDISDLATAARFGGPGNIRYTWTVHGTKGGFDYEVTAKGKDRRRLDRYSIKRLGGQLEPE